MATSPSPRDIKMSPDAVARATSELNNLLQIIAGTSSALESGGNTSGEAEEYRKLLRRSIDRAEQVAVELARQAGGATEKQILPSDLGALENASQTRHQISTTRTILLVDDEEATLSLMERTLSEAGFHVVTAQSAFQCLDLFRGYPNRFAMVLLDLSLPFIDGEETFHRLRQFRNDIPVVLCTGFILEERLREMMAAGLSGFLRKPVAPEELIAVVHSTLIGAKYLTDNAATCDVPLAI